MPLDGLDQDPRLEAPRRAGLRGGAESATIGP